MLTLTSRETEVVHLVGKGGVTGSGEPSARLLASAGEFEVAAGWMNTSAGWGEPLHRVAREDAIARRGGRASFSVAIG